MRIATAVQRYNALLEGDASLARESGEMLTARQPGMRLTFGGRPICRSLRPQFMTAEHFAAVGRTCVLLAGAAKRLVAVLLADPRLRDVLDLDEDERRLVAVEPGFEDAAASTRLDSFVAGDDWHFVEYNAESPAGMGYTDLLVDLFRELPVMRAFERQVALRPLTTRRSMLDTLLRAYHQWGGRAAPVIAIVDWEGLATATEFEIFREFFLREGVQAIITTPAALEFRDGRLYAGATPIELVYRRALMHELLARKDEAAALLRAYEAGAVCVVNAFRCKLLHKKAIFAVLSDEENAHLFTPEEHEAIRRHIPWTRKVRDGYTSYRGGQVDLTAHVLANRERLVLKPNDEYGGKGVVLGWETAPGVWEEALRGALAGSYVVQERVPTEQTPYPIYQDGVLHMVEMTTDLDPYIFDQRRVDGMLTRVSAASLLNVTAGTASTLPTFLIEGGIG